MHVVLQMDLHVRVPEVGERWWVFWVLSKVFGIVRGRAPTQHTKFGVDVGRGSPFPGRFQDRSVGQGSFEYP